jgi:hypothetical protein
MARSVKRVMTLPINVIFSHLQVRILFPSWREHHFNGTKLKNLFLTVVEKDSSFDMAI